jgi:beta-lactamase class A
MKTTLFTRLAAAAALIALPLAPAHAEEQSVEAAFDALFSSQAQAPRQQAAPAASVATARATTASGLIPVTRQPMAASYRNPFEQQIALLAEDSQGRIGVAAMDLATGQSISVLGEQAFPMASTSKIAIVATYLEQVDQGRLSLTSEFPISGSQHLPAHQLIDMVITRSSNPATDALLRAVGGVGPVNAWARRAGIENFNLTRDIATLVREDGRVNPADYIDLRDSSTPQAMVDLLTGIYQGRWLTPESRRVIISAMERCRTGTRRIPAMMPAGVTVAHKTGSLNNTSSDIGIITAPDGRSIAVAIYVTGQGTRAAREARIASIARAIYDGFTDTGRVFANASYSNTGS